MKHDIEIDLAGFDQKYKIFKQLQDLRYEKQMKTGIALTGPSGTGKSSFMKRVS